MGVWIAALELHVSHMGPCSCHPLARLPLLTRKQRHFHCAQLHLAADCNQFTSAVCCYHRKILTHPPTRRACRHRSYKSHWQYPKAGHGMWQVRVPSGGGCQCALAVPNGLQTPPATAAALQYSSHLHWHPCHCVSYFLSWAGSGAFWQGSTYDRSDAALGGQLGLLFCSVLHSRYLGLCLASIFRRSHLCVSVSPSWRRAGQHLQTVVSRPGILGMQRPPGMPA